MHDMIKAVLADELCFVKQAGIPITVLTVSLHDWLHRLFTRILLMVQHTTSLTSVILTTDPIWPVPVELVPRVLR